MVNARRLIWVDVGRGMGIILVVYYHALSGLVDASLVDGRAVVLWTEYLLGAFMMPMFFLLAGMALEPSLAKGTQKFLTARAWTIVYPYFLWSLIQGGLVLLFNRSVNNPGSVSDLLSIGWAPIGQFWFLYALAVCHLMGVLLRRQAVLLWAVVVIGYPVWTLFPVDHIVGQTAEGLSFYALGMLIGPRILNWSPRPREGWLLFGGILALFVAYAVPTGMAYGLTMSRMIVLPMALLGLAWFVLLSKLIQGPLAHGLAWFGERSMTIYVLHILATSGLRILMTAGGIALEPVPYVIATTAAGLLLPAIAHVVLERLGVLHLAGFATPRPPRRTPAVAVA
ncbi:acyltransferase family protein [Zavarzinia sp. CC-PAN008]|uniref:acyltransferase family protein n=1 Tax=Zavarzinia sp. CC-PAN008 TaxID=3243332 RepID=UPI003F749F9B